MGIEIERKFLLLNDAWRSVVERSQLFGQGYLASGDFSSVRVRVTDEAAWLTVKGRRAGIARHEFEYPVPVADARQMLEQLCGNRVIEKTRHWVPFADHTWEIDEFQGANRGLILAEIELSRADEHFERPAWVGQEVSEDPRYFNAYLAEHPYPTWS